MTSGYYTTTRSDTFTHTHAVHITAKMAADLKRMQRFYMRPADDEIADYQREAVALLKGEYLDTVTYGFRRDTNWVVALHYAAQQGGVMIEDDSPGQIPVGVAIDGQCRFASFLCYNRNWDGLSANQQEQLYKDAGIKLRRTSGDEPYGAWRYDKVYSAGGRGVSRGVVG